VSSELVIRVRAPTAAPACKAVPVFRKGIEIRWRDMDAFGHVNNATYLTYLEEARDELLTGLLGDEAHRVVMRRVEIDFLTGLTQDDDRVTVEVTIARIGSSSVTTAERIVADSDGRVAAEARSVVVYTDASRRASAPLPDRVRQVLEGAAA
jgi:acyl-CoA thioester hydrolase